MESIEKSNIRVILYSIKTIAEEFIKQNYIQRIPRVMIGLKTMVKRQTFSDKLHH